MKKRKRDRTTQNAASAKILLLPSGYEADLHRMVDDIFEEAVAQKWNLPELAHRAHLCYVTVWKLSHRITRFPRTDTIWKLAKATGFAVKLVQKRAGAPRAITFKKVESL